MTVLRFNEDWRWIQVDWTSTCRDPDIDFFPYDFGRHAPAKIAGKTCLRPFVANTGRIDIKTRQIDAKSHSLQKVGWQLVLKVNIGEVIQIGGNVAEI